jgi:hypothetical protein
MMLSTRLFLYAYACLLNLFPRGYRTEYGEELQSVFRLVMEDADFKGGLSVLRMGLHELRDFPSTIVREHIRERRKKTLETQAHDLQFNDPLSRRALLVGVGLFLLVLIAELSFPPLYLGLFAFAVTVSSVGIIKGLPIWALPSIGLLLSGLVLSGRGILELSWLKSLLKDQIVTVGYELSRYVYSAIYQGIFWVSLLLLTIILFLILTALPRYRPLSQRLKHDWTLLSFTFYGASAVVLFINWDNYLYLEPYKFAAILFLAGGAWGYLRSTSSRKRLLSLLAGAILAMTTIAIGKWILVPQQEWTQWFQWFPPQTERWFESLRTLIELGWIMIVLAVPGLLGLLWRKMDKTSTTSPTLVP